VKGEAGDGLMLIALAIEPNVPVSPRATLGERLLAELHEQKRVAKAA
jgi:hypothetical protein